MSRVPVAKTAKMFVGGQFVRSESGRTFPVPSGLGEACLASRKDVRDAVRVARGAQPGWASRTPYNRGQILYRLAEMLEARAATLVSTLSAEAGLSRAEAKREVEAAVDRTVHYAGWCDKFAQCLGSVNPVGGPFFNFSWPEPVGVVGVLAPSASPLCGLLALCLPPIVSGGTVVAAATFPMTSVELAEALATSDLPPGVCNLLTGDRAELAKTLATHRDVDAVADGDGDPDSRRELLAEAADNLKRVRSFGPMSVAEWRSDRAHGLAWIQAFIEIKTVWHPVGV